MRHVNLSLPLVLFHPVAYRPSRTPFSVLIHVDIDQMSDNSLGGLPIYRQAQLIDQDMGQENLTFLLVRLGFASFSFPREDLRFAHPVRR